MPPPKAQDSSQQAALDALWKLLEDYQWKCKYQSETNQKDKNLRAHDQELKKWKDVKTPFPQQEKVLQERRDKAATERNETHQKWKQYRNKFSERASTFVDTVAELVKAQSASVVNKPARLAAPIFSDPAPMIASLEGRFAVLERQCEKSTKEVEILQQERKAADIKIKELEANRVAANLKIKELESSRGTADQEMKDLEALIEGLSKKESTDELTRKELEGVRKRLHKQEGRTTKLEEQTDALARDVNAVKHNATQENLRQNVDELQKGFKSLQDGNARVEKELPGVHRNIDALQRRADSLERENSASEKGLKNVEQLEKRVEAHTRALDKHESKLQAVGDLNTKVAKLDDGLSTLQGAFDDMDPRRIEMIVDHWNHNDTGNMILEFKHLLGELRTDVGKHEQMLEAVGDMSAKIAALGSGLSTLQGALEDMDPERIEKIMDHWTHHDLGNTVLESKRWLGKLQADFDSVKASRSVDGHFQEQGKLSRPSSMEPRQQILSTAATEALERKWDDVRQEVSSLRQKISSLEKSVSEGEKSLLEKVQNTVVQGSEMMASEIDAVVDTTKAIAARVGILESKGIQARTPAPTPQHDSRGSPGTVDSQLADRIKAIEDADLGATVTQLVSRLDQHMQQCSQIQAFNNAEFEKAKGTVQGLNTALTELGNQLRGQLDQQEMQFQNLNSHFNNMHTRGMAQTVLSELDSYTTRLTPRFDLVNARLDRMDQRFEGIISRSRPSPNVQDASGKRPGSLEPDAASKRRRVEPNGIVASASAPPQQRQPIRSPQLPFQFGPSF
ncbi:hypothetical protein KJ359_010046 [Pestalotiopsis sp. 9143b]|nr:hypothetical protein KJ359_010046 [Pestalotiopsis sp. 9143b]